MKLIKLTRGKFAIIDNCDFELVSRYRWRADHRGRCWYARSDSGVDMHRLILGEPTSEVDHKNCDGLDNRRRNLRQASSTQQKANSRRRTDNRSGFKGVCWNCGWRASITVCGKRISLGYYPTPKQAHDAYFAAARFIFGEFARAA